MIVRWRGIRYWYATFSHGVQRSAWRQLARWFYDWRQERRRGRELDGLAQGPPPFSRKPGESDDEFRTRIKMLFSGRPQ